MDQDFTADDLRYALENAAEFLEMNEPDLELRDAKRQAAANLEAAKRIRRMANRITPIKPEGE